MKALWNVLQGAVGWIFPIFAKARQLHATSSRVRWTIHTILVVLILAGLTVLNRVYLVGFLPTAHPVVRGAWLPLLFVLFYALVWLLWWLFQILTPDAEAAQFPDIDADWAECLEALTQADVDLTRVPVFLVLGEAEGGEEVFFRAGANATPPVFSLVKYAPRRSDASVRIFVSREAVFITCAQASLLGHHAKVLNGLPAMMMEEPAAKFGGGGGGGEDDNFGTIGGAMLGTILGGMEDPMMATLYKAPGQVFGTPVKKASLRSLRASVLQNPTESARLTARLQHVCRLINRERAPRCPINGVLLLIPVAGTDNDGDANNTGMVIQTDLATISNTFRVRCPLISIVADLERLKGFKEFVKRIPPEQRNNRIGQRHPWVPDLTAEQLPEAIRAEVQWICEGLIGFWIFKLFDVDPTVPLEDQKIDPLKGNADLFQFLYHMRERQQRLAKVISTFVRVGDKMMFGGCYLAGTGGTPTEQAFLPGVMHKLIESQDFVAWDPSVIEEDEQFGAWASYGYVGLVVLVIGMVGLGWVLTRK